MILSCPSCRARYVVPDNAIGGGGRKVRCVKCRFSWFQEGPEGTAPPTEDAGIEPAAAPPPTDARPDGEAERPRTRQILRPDRSAEEEPRAAEPAAEPVAWPPEEPEEEPRRARRNRGRMWTILAVLAALLMAGALAAIYFIGPERIAAWTGTAAETDLLEFTRSEVTSEPLPTGTSLVTVTGEITNRSGRELRVPQIRADVFDAPAPGGNLIHSWTIAPPVRQLQPGAAATFSGASTDVPQGARRIDLVFGPTT